MKDRIKRLKGRTEIKKRVKQEIGEGHDDEDKKKGRRRRIRIKKKKVVM